MSRPSSPPLRVLKFPKKEVEQVMARVQAQISADDFTMLRAFVDTFEGVLKALREHGTTIARLRWLFGLSRSSEKLVGLVKPPEPPTPPEPPCAHAPEATTTLTGAASADPKGVASAATSDEAAKPADEGQGTKEKEKKKRKGHGRLAASDYLAANHIPVPHPTLHEGGPCPHCGGHLHFKPPSSWVRIFGQAPLLATIWDLEQVRCSTCGHVFTAPAPQEAQGPKYDHTAVSMMALMRYDGKMALNRLARLQREIDTPVAASTQWEVVCERVADVFPAYAELERQGAQGTVLHNDDSHMRVLEFMGKRRAALLKAGKLPDPDRTGLFTTAIVARTPDSHTIALFYTGRQHAGENLDDLLDQRDPGREPPIQMGDALARNVPKRHKVVESNCLAHGRRKLVDEIDNYPVECRPLLEKLALVFAVDEACREEGLSSSERLLRHQRDSGPAMEELRRMMTEAVDQKQVEPNSGLGQAYNYLLKRWDHFTLFLRTAGAPLDNNICERALKMAIGHRHGSLFYRNLVGAAVGDIYMSLIHTARLAHENPFLYLTALLRHAKAVLENPGAWLPWNYRDTLARMGVPIATGPPKPRAPAAALTPPTPA